MDDSANNLVASLNNLPALLTSKSSDGYESEQSHLRNQSPTDLRSFFDSSSLTRLTRRLSLTVSTTCPRGCMSTQRALVGWDWLNIEGKNSPYGKRLAQPIMGKTKKETGDDTDSRKALEICKNLQALKMTPKEFMITFLTSKNSDLAS
ncbi:hypothetical protein PSHT_06193 [Puccinia striiformis]|uniref:Uncharacterized protein n=1 Tax=Puccinia striiformis TaxID=27350 RepID=A0A2S4W8L3_9BASI|nr:hypothetical protein PSHT_06193 [Puccinia striiformis]